MEERKPKREKIKMKKIKEPKREEEKEIEETYNLKSYYKKIMKEKEIFEKEYGKCNLKLTLINDKIIYCETERILESEDRSDSDEVICVRDGLSIIIGTDGTSSVLAIVELDIMDHKNLTLPKDYSLLEDISNRLKNNIYLDDNEINRYELLTRIICNYTIGDHTHLDMHLLDYVFIRYKFDVMHYEKLLKQICPEEIFKHRV